MAKKSPKLEVLQRNEKVLSKGIEKSILELKRYDLKSFIPQIKFIIRNRRGELGFGDGGSFGVIFMKALDLVSISENKPDDLVQSLRRKPEETMPVVSFARALNVLYVMGKGRAEIQAVIGGFNITPEEIEELALNQGNAVIEEALDRFVPGWKSFFEAETK